MAAPKWFQKTLVAALLVVIGGACFVIVRSLLGPSHPHLHAAQEAMARRAFRQARQHLEMHLREKPTDQAAHLLAAQVARRQGEGDAHDLLEKYEQAFGPGAAVAQERRLLRLHQGDLTGAGALLGKCANELSLQDAAPLLEALMEGSLQSVYGDLLQEAANLNRESLVDLKFAERVLDVWEKRCTNPPDRIQALVWRGQMHSLARDYAQAEEAFQKALGLDGAHFQARLFLAEVLVWNSPKEACRHFEKLRLQDPDNLQVCYRLASVQRSLGLLDQAQTLLEEVLASAPGHVPALLERGHLALETQQMADAERWLRRTVQYAPDHAEANLSLARCLRQLGKDAEAKVYQDRFQQIDTERPRRKSLKN